MNSTYAYFIISKTWDLDYDVLQLVKKWLEPHLKRRILNEDYNQFMKMAESNFSASSVSFNTKQNSMLSRYGFKNNVNHYMKLRENMNYFSNYKVVPYRLDELHEEYSTNYKIFGISITMRDRVVYLNRATAGTTDYSRNLFITHFRYLNPKHWRWKWPLTPEEQKKIIRKIMDKEEEIIMDTWEDY